MQRELALGSYKTAWFLLHRIRHAMETKSWDKPMEGVIEVDETYVGGKPRFVPGRGNHKRGRGTAKKPVIALVQRDGMVRSTPVDGVDLVTLRSAVRVSASPDSTIITDELNLYSGLKYEFASHETVCHSTKEYARKRADGLVVHTNTVESYFALLKRGHYGVYHQMGKPHLHRYVSEFAFRWNHRGVKDAERRDAAIKQAPGKRLKYKTSAKSA